MADKPWRDYDTLHKLKVEKRLSHEEMAAELGCSTATISKWVNELDVKWPWRDEEILRELYFEEMLSLTQIADRLDCSLHAVQNGFERHNIERRSKAEGGSIRRLDEETHKRLSSEPYLRNEYVDRGKSTTTIANELDVSAHTVGEWLKKHGIAPDYSGYSFSEEVWQKLNDGEWLEAQYWEEDKTVGEIADGLGCSKRTLLGYLSENDIPRRDAQERAELIHGPNDRIGYGPNWTEQRELARQRDNYECVICGLGQEKHLQWCNNALHVHHITPRKAFVEDGELDYETANRLENLITLCATCHGKWEGVPVRPQNMEDK